VRAWILALAFLAIVVACGGDDEPTSARLLTETAFADRAAAAIVTETELNAARAGTLRVSVSSDASLNTFSVPLEEPYATYRAQPSRLDELLSGLVADADATMEDGNADRSFGQVRSRLMPLLKPITALRGLDSPPATTPFPGNLHIVYLVERDDSLTAVTEDDLERWDRSLEDIHGIAVDNLLRQTNREEPLRCEEDLCGWASGDGWDAARMIVPELRRQIVEEIGPAVHAVPTESVYVALPIKLADRIRPRVQEDFVTADRPVSQDLFVERRGALVVLPA
jgi:hypothetical protein